VRTPSRVWSKGQPAGEVAPSPRQATLSETSIGTGLEMMSPTGEVFWT
jgi:hypothetical protein